MVFAALGKPQPVSIDADLLQGPSEIHVPCDRLRQPVRVVRVVTERALTFPSLNVNE